MFSQSVDNQRPQPFREVDESSSTSNLLQYGGSATSSPNTEAEDDPALPVMLWTFWVAAGLNALFFPIFVLIAEIDDNSIGVGVFITLLVLLIAVPMLIFLVNSIFLCMGRVPGRGLLGPCDCKRPFCQSKPYAITSAVFLGLNTILIVTYILGVSLSQ